jgi:hypothetical protein
LTLRVVALVLFCLLVAKADGTYTNPIIDADYSDPDVIHDGRCAFSYSTDGKTFAILGEPFTAKPGVWIGAKVGLFSIGAGQGYADYDWFRFSPPEQSAQTRAHVQ